MRGTKFNVLANNIHALAPSTAFNKYRNGKPKMCWDCQKEKPIQGGFLRFHSGIHKFVCKDCLDASAARKEAKEKNDP